MKHTSLNRSLALAVLLLLAPAGMLAQEGYYGMETRSDTYRQGTETILPVLAAQSDTYSGSGEGYYGAQQPSDTNAQSQQVNSPNIRRKNAMPIFQAGPDRSAPQNHVEYGGV
jgi:hypothetical protein